MPDRQTQFAQLLASFPDPIREAVQSIPPNSGKLDFRHCRAATQTAGLLPESLMIKLLPVAKLFARVPISHFPVGTVVKAQLSDRCDDFALFIGANIEFEGQALTQTIHAEQAAVVNAWQQGAVQIDAIAVSAAPCGRCRQFLYELHAQRSLTVMVSQPDGAGYTSTSLSDLLPQAFSPQDLAVEAGFISSRKNLPELDLKILNDDPLVRQALAAAARTFAPYTHNFAGCAIQLSDQKIYTGSYVETAAFNPSLSPLHTAIIRLNMDGLATDANISRAILVEKPTAISQRGVSELLLDSLVPGLRLEVYEIR